MEHYEVLKFQPTDMKKHQIPEREVAEPMSKLDNSRHAFNSPCSDCKLICTYLTLEPSPLHGPAINAREVLSICGSYTIVLSSLYVT